MWIELEDGNRKPDERKELRWNIPIPVSVKGVRTDGTEFNEQTITTDASPSGMCVLLTVALRKGDQVTVTAPEEKFESSATVRYVSALGPGMNRIRINFPKSAKFTRESAAKKYVYDYYNGQWVGYIVDDIYYNTKHEAFGKIENNKIVSLDSGALLFDLSAGRAYDTHGNCIGHII
ncbi:MAG: hypothetical protein WB763_03735 [Terriglobia bacterium]|jgi:hypothetical protein